MEDTFRAGSFVVHGSYIVHKDNLENKIKAEQQIEALEKRISEAAKHQVNGVYPDYTTSAALDDSGQHRVVVIVRDGGYDVFVQDMLSGEKTVDITLDEYNSILSVLDQLNDHLRYNEHTFERGSNAFLQRIEYRDLYYKSGRHPVTNPVRGSPLPESYNAINDKLFKQGTIKEVRDEDAR